MAGMNENGWKLLETAGIGLKCLEWLKNVLTLLEMAGNGWKLPEMAEMVGN